MKLKIYLNKSIEENAGIYFDISKKSRKKIKGAEETIEKSKKKLNKLKLKEIKEKKEEITVKRKKEWYEKFRWFHSSEGFLVIGGRDATSNEVLIKKHVTENDIVFHAEMSGSPFFVIKTENKKPSNITLEETAIATASYSRAWKLGINSVDVFYVKPKQVSKEAESGEYMSKGSFMIRGKKEIMHPKLELAIGIKENIILGGPINAIKKNSDKFFILNIGKDKSSDIAKFLKKEFNFKDSDELIWHMPAGGIKIIR